MELESEVLLENPELLEEFETEQGYLDTANSNIENHAVQIPAKDDPAMDKLYGETETKEDKAREFLELIRKSLEENPEDIDQAALIKSIQNNRTFLLESAMLAYMNKPNSASLLEGVTALFAQMEKTVRDDRKERAKKKEMEGNQVSFNQLLEAMQQISTGQITLPTFDINTAFILDPTQSLIPEGSGIKPIKAEELEMGNRLVDIDGNSIN